MSVIGSNILAGASGAGGGYQISRSVRLRSSASAYLTRTPSVAGNRQKWTYSTWFKRGALGSDGALLATPTIGGVSYDALYFNSSNQFRYVTTDNGSTINTDLLTTQVFRDPSAWYHIVIAVDTTQATASNRIKIYINGSQVTTFSTSTYPPQNRNTNILSTTAMDIGRWATSSYYDGYCAENNLIDGQQLDASSFGETNPATGVWKPKKYTGTYGTQGSYINFSDNSAATAAAIGKDYSSNGNNWTPNNITLSPTTSVSYDSMLDVPTQWADGGNGRGNYCVLSPLAKSTNITVSDGNLYATSSAASYNAVLGTMAPASGKWYFEMTLNASVAAPDIGWHQSEYTSAQLTAFSTTTRDGGYCIATDGTGTANTFVFNNGTRTTVANTGWATNDVIGCAIDIDNKKIWFSRNGTWYPASVGGSAGDPANGTNQAITYTYTGLLLPRTSAYSGGYSSVVNFGQRPFAYTPPSGFKALNTLNLPTPTILKGNQYFDATLYTGNGTSQSIVNSGGFQPDLVWVKERSGTRDHRLVDAVRGVGKELYSSLTFAEATDASGLTSFNSNGYSIGSSVGYNANGVTQVGWQWKEGATQGFDIVTYTGNGAASQVVNHSLGVAPNFVIVKNRSASASWNVWGSQGFTRLGLNITNGDLGNFPITRGSSSITLPSTSDVGWNSNGNNYVAYLFAEVSQFSKAFSFTGNGSTDGVFVFTGFLPRLILLKRTDTTGNWYLWDTARNTFNALGEELYPNLSNAAASATDLDVLSNGFKMRNSTAGFNASGGTYIGFAWASNPFKYSLGF